MDKALDQRREDYVYSLGIYLGDGCIDAMPRTFRMRITLDDKYPNVIREAASRVASVLPDNRVSVIPRRLSACSDVYVHSKHLPTLFPRQTRGRKHESDLPIVQWQTELVKDLPAAFLRGFFHADGSFSPNFSRGRSYPRYLFKNSSEQILDLTRTALDRLGLHHTRSAVDTISVARKQDVAVLRDVCGMKS